MNHENHGHWGDVLKRKNNNSTRILLHNTGGIGFISDERSKDTLKMERLKDLTIKYDIDLVCLTEVNRDWRSIDQKNTIWNGTSGWKENRCVQISQNTTKKSEGEFLVGGTAMVAFDELKFHISSQGADDRKLGRWSYMTITGKNAIKTTLITCYCPVISNSPGSAYSQHLIYMAENTNKVPEGIICPRQLYGYDLNKFIISKSEAGHKVIILGDFNSNYAELNNWMNNIGCGDLLNQKHGTCPITYQRSHTDPIDCCFGDGSLRISKGGCLSFGRLISDHRGLWMDIPNEILFGFNPPPLTHPSARRLKMKDPRCVKRYNDMLHNDCEKEHLYQRMDALHSTVSDPMTEQQMEEYEFLDAKLCNMMDNAELKCRKLTVGSVPWSPTYKRANLALEYWRMRKAHCLGLHRNVRQLIVLQRKLEIIYDPSLNLTQIVEKIKEASRQRIQIKRMAASLSLEYRTKLALAKEEAGEVKAAEYIRSLNRIEAQRKLYQNIRVMEKKLKGGSTSKVTVTTTDGTVHEYTGKKQMERVIAKSNEAQWHKTEGGSQLHNIEFIEKLGSYGEGPEVQKVLDGKFQFPNSTSIDTRDFINACKLPDQNSTVSSEDNVSTRYKKNIQSWQARRESTCTYGQHIGHYQATTQHKYLSWLIFQRGDIPAMTSYASVRHKQCIDLMILKKAQTFELKSQRILGILDTEFNNNNGFIGRDATRKGIKLGAVAEEQFARPNRSSIQEIIGKRCTIDHQQSIRESFALTSCDLAGCYDRIIHTAASLALLRIGVSHSRIKSMFGTIQKMIHRIRTIYGISDITYGGELGEWDSWPQGVLQGNAAGPAIWSTVSSVIFDILHKRGFSSKITSAISKQLFTLIGFAYVDDCDLFQVGEDPKLVLESMQDLINSWGSLMEVTGGVIRIDKSWWYLVDYVWKRGKWIGTDSHADLDLVAKGTDGKVVSLKRLRCDEAAEMLGVWLAPNGNKQKIISVLKKNALDWGSKVRLGNPSTTEAWTALHTNISSKLKYPVTACTFTEGECKGIMFPAIKAALPKAGITSTIEQSMRDGPVSTLGTGVLSLYHFMGTSRTACLVEQLEHNTPLGKIFRINIEDLVAESGLYGHIWDMDMGYLQKYVSSHSWMYHTLLYNHQHNIDISSAHATLKAQRTGDRAIMDIAREHFKAASDLKSINRVRMKYGVIHISDITTANGISLLQNYLKDKLYKSSRNTHGWPKKHNVVAADYTIWRELLKWIFPLENYKLYSRLQDWLIEENWLKSWDWYAPNTSEFIYHKQTEGIWHRHLKRKNGHHTYHSEFLTMLECPTDIKYRISVKATDGNFRILNSSCFKDYPPPEESGNITFDAVEIKYPAIQWFMKHLHSTPSTKKLYSSLLNGTALAVSDGSYFPDQKVGSCAWVLSSSDGSEYIAGGGIIPGSEGEQSSYRSELGGQVGIANVVNNLILPQQTNKKKRHITTICDGLSALETVGKEKEFIKVKHKHADLISITSSLWHSSAFHFTREHVKAHQDDFNMPLTIEETLNCSMDTLAKKIATEQINSDHRASFHTTSIGFGSVSCTGVLVTSRLQQSLYHSILHNNTIQRLAVLLGLSPTLLKEKVNWKVLSTARKEASLPSKIFISKWVSGDIATGKVMVMRKKRLHSNCPICNSPEEDTTHVLQCPSPLTSSLRASLLLELKVWLESKDTLADITTFIISGLTSWFSNTPFNLCESSLDRQTLMAFKTQQLLGWRALLFGTVADGLVTCQQYHYKTVNSRKSGTRWGIQLVAKLWNIIYQLWIHRNNCLHDTEMINSLSGKNMLETAIIHEHTLGIKDLPSVYKSYFSSLSKLQEKSIKHQKQWFLVIRSGREACLTFSHYDRFSTDPTLRSWVGLSALP